MSTTTTSTTTYIITTYRYQQDKPGAIRPRVPNDEWKIYKSNTSSLLQLTLETTKTASGNYIAVVMKIVDTDETRPGGAIILETMDFLDFSGPEVAKLTSPLKGVLSGKQVGFRYLHPLKADASSQYHKRIQLTLTSPEDASALVTSIRHVCPIQASNQKQTGSIKPTQQSKAMPTPSTSTRGVQPELQESIDSGRVSVTNASQARTSSVKAQMNEQIRENFIPPGQPTFNSSPLNSRVDTPTTSKEFQPDPKLTQHSMLPPSQLNFSQSHQMQQPFTSSRPSPLPSPTLPTSPLRTLAPSSGLLFDSSSALARPQQTPTPDSSVGTPNGPFLSNFQLHGLTPGETDIHKLSAHELETMVAQVVHEPGFTELMERLDGMYALKGFIKS